MALTDKTRTSRRVDYGVWPWALAVGGLLFLIGGALHPDEDSSLPEAEATAESLGSATWIPSHALLLAGTIGFLIGLFALARSRTPLSKAARRAAWIAAVGAVLFAVEGVFHLAAFADEEAALAGTDTPLLSTHMAMGLGAVDAVAFGVAPALVGLAGIEALGFLFPLGGIVMALWFTLTGVTALIRGSGRRIAAV